MRIRIPPSTEALELQLVGAGGRAPPEIPDTPAAVALGILGRVWGQKNRGRSGELGPERRGVVDIVSSTGDDQLATQTTVTCQIGRTQDGGPNFPPVVGELEFGNDGFCARAEFDFTHGVQVTVPGSFVRLAARFDLDAPDMEAPLPVLKVGGQLSYLPAATRPVHRTRYLTLAPDAAGVVDVPPFAAAVSVLHSGASGSVQVDYLDRLGSVITSQVVPPLVLPVPNDARQLQITELAAATIEVRAVFELWL